MPWALALPSPSTRPRKSKTWLSRGETIAHPYIGVQIADLTPELAKRNNADINSGIYLPEVDGVLVIRVLEGTPPPMPGSAGGM
jgi:S1-C subfamily serine protease